MLHSLLEVLSLLLMAFSGLVVTWIALGSPRKHHPLNPLWGRADPRRNGRDRGAPAGDCDRLPTRDPE